jgi:hypothetical protein
MKNISNHWLIINVFFLFIVFPGCDKQDYTLPVDFRMSYSVKEEPVMNGSVTIDYIGISLKSIDIRGYREQGGDVFLTRSYDEGKIFRIYPPANTDPEKFNIPHGLYDPISFSFLFQPDEEESDIIEDILQWLEDFEEEDDLIKLQEDLGDIITDYLEEIDPCMIVKGKFTHNFVTKNIVIVVNDPLIFNIFGESGVGLSEVFLDRTKINYGLILFTPAYWFSVITPEIMNTAFAGLIDDQEYILLSKYINSQIYFTLFNRIEESTTLVIND